ncbi:MAG TPA: hypothetical protein PK140_13860 [Polyangiaceae bacterium]|nr:hypothetical protein [Polyangiaceae bacterium]HQM10481.1 hypothetical protein [Polyangiaceae bacterium]
MKHVSYRASLQHNMPIDDPHETAALLDALDASLPIPMMIGAELKTLLKSKGLKIDTAAPVLVEKTFYAGDEGGILAGLRASDTENQLVVSITHLVPPLDHPLAEKIIEYQRHRVMSIARQHGRPSPQRPSRKNKRKRK